jgi:riboflavin kinase/FMN adenylyltransferase
MQVVHDRQAGPRGGILTLGTFDGVHRGHQALLRVARSRAQALGTFVEVWLYHPHPRQVLRGETVPLLTLLPERLHL